MDLLTDSSKTYNDGISRQTAISQTIKGKAYRNAPLTFRVVIVNEITAKLTEDQD